MLRALVLLVFLAFVPLAFVPLVQADASGLAECGPGQEKLVVTSDEESAAAAACVQEAFPWHWLAGAGAGAVAFSWSWLAWLRWLPAMGLFTRIRQDRLLDHPVRAQIFELIENEPGIHYQAIVQRLDRSGSSVMHHLSMLVRAGLLSTVARPGHRSFFVKGRIDASVMRGLAVVRSDTGAELLRTVQRRPGIHKRPLARELGCRESAIRYHVRRFAQAGILREDEGLHLLPVGQEVLALMPEPVPAPTRPPGVAA